jgi:glycosyltransferase involved in cell wall biosynthesis
MRILFVLHQFFPEFAGGTERVALNMARMAQHAGHHVQVLASTVNVEKSGGSSSDKAPQGCLELVYQGLPVTLIPTNLLPATSDISMDASDEVVAGLADWIASKCFDVAHVLHAMRMGSALLALQRCDVPFVLSLTDFFLPCARINLITMRNKPCNGPDGGRLCQHNCPTVPWTSEAYVGRFEQAHSILKSAGARIAPSEYVAGRYREIFPDIDFQVIPHGVDLLAMTAQSEPVLAPLQPINELHIVYVGTIIPQKGLDILLRALALIPNAHVRLKVIGGLFGEPDYHEEIKRLASADDRVELVGSMDGRQVFQALRRAMVLCLPSVVPESFSLVLHESAAAGIPALVSNLGAPAELMQVHGCGRAVEAGDPQAWAAAIQELVDVPETLNQWKDKLFLPLRIEEEAFFLESVYQRLRCE